ncbi:Chromosome-associated kinesin KIF4B [Schistosoma japonicum]|nr:Chromosome-associated kinesin KIF4B [Schistosoma japonicum]
MESGDISVKVGVRVRPLSDSEINEGSSICLSYPSDEHQLIIGNDKVFGFDYVFRETDSQEYVYRKAALPMIESILKGYNATLFAYGQTGSGKTYTMGTYVSDGVAESSIGIVPRIIRDLFKKMPEYDYEYTVKVSFLEIYKEDIHDLLGEDVSTSLQIREENQLIKIPGLTESLVTSPEQVLAVLQSGSTKRSVASTAMNLKSSRSHAILTLCFLMRPKMTQLDTENTEDTLTAKLHLVDLAGSERIKKTHAEGDRLKEGIDINRGLLALGNVISALCERDAKKRSHIPYRDSRLTRLLQDSLGGNSATLMLACVSPADVNMEETLNTLRYADRARLIKNKPILNRADPKDAELARLRVLVAQLQTRLASGSYFPPLSPCPKTIGEKLSLCAELNRTIDKMNELYKKCFYINSLHDALHSELQKLESLFNFLKQCIKDKSNEYPELTCYIQELEDIITELMKLHSTESNKIPSEDFENVYKQSADFLSNVRSDSVCFDVDEEQEVVVLDKMPLDPHTEVTWNNDRNCVSDVNTTETVVESQAVDRWGCELRARRLECKQRIETIEATIRQKNDLLSSLEAAAEQGDESYCLLLKKYECQIRELESRVIDLEQEKCKLLMEQNNEELKDSKSQREARLKSMEQELIQTRRQLTELSRLKKAKEAREAECLRLRNEMQSLKASMIRSAKQLKEESAAYRKWRKEKENEVRRLQEHDRRLQYEMSRMISVHEREQTVLKRRIEAAAAAERRLKELLLRQKDNKNERDKRVCEGSTAKNKVDLGTRVRAWVKLDLDLQISMDAVRHHLSQLMDSRKRLCDQLRAIELKIETHRETSESYAMYIDEVNRLNDLIQSQTEQISDLQQKLIDAGERSSTDASGVSDPSGKILSSRLAQMHSIQEARIALMYLFKQASLSEVSKINLETQIFDLESQVTSQKEKIDCLLQTAEKYSTELSKYEENNCHLKDQLKENNEYIEYLKNQNNSLQEALQFALTSTKNVHTNNPSTESLTSRLSSTPVLRQHNNNCILNLSSDDENLKPQTIVHHKNENSISKRLHMDCDNVGDDGDEPEMKIKKAVDEWSLPFSVENDIHSNVDGDSRQSTRCRCRGTCQSRCSCKRSGRLCMSSNCQCILGRCVNRQDLSLEPINKVLNQTENLTTLMGPPLDVPVIPRPRRKLRPLQLNVTSDEVKEQKNTTCLLMNETYNLDNQCISSSNNNNNHVVENDDDLQSPTVPTDGSTGVLRCLWPKNRLSYFPSPLLRPDK